VAPTTNKLFNVRRNIGNQQQGDVAGYVMQIERMALGLKSKMTGPIKRDEIYEI
jgi:hypothetical protein